MMEETTKACCNKKHPCPDCNFCQFCAEIRCIACRREKSKPKLSAEEQIRRFEELNQDRQAPGEAIYYKK
jgi:hypothetical protein